MEVIDENKIVKGAYTSTFSWSMKHIAFKKKRGKRSRLKVNKKWYHTILDGLQSNWVSQEKVVKVKMKNYVALASPGLQNSGRSRTKDILWGN